jgi:hypothetical protein
MVSTFIVEVKFLNIRGGSILTAPRLVKDFHTPSSGFEQGFPEENIV